LVLRGQMSVLNRIHRCARFAVFATIALGSSAWGDGAFFSRAQDSRGRIEILLSIGYGDFNGKVTNSSERNYYAKSLKEFGFTRKPAAPGTSTVWANRDQTWVNGRGDRVRILDSAWSEDDRTNRKTQEQWKLSNYVADQVWKAIKKNKGVVIYSGHNRDEGGAWSFSPPQLTGSRHVDYDFYARNQAGSQRMLQAKRSDPDRIGPALIGIFSCGSDRGIGIQTSDNPGSLGALLTGKTVRKAFSDSAFVTTMRTTYDGENTSNVIELVYHLVNRSPMNQWTLGWVQRPYEIAWAPSETSVRISPALR
jgi:hypothetical protein